jgi:hypothetical protein
VSLPAVSLVAALHSRKAKAATSRRTPYAAASILWPLIPMGFYLHSLHLIWVTLATARGTDPYGHLITDIEVEIMANAERYIAARRYSSLQRETPRDKPVAS